jgi:hypothetical protein
MGHCLAAVVLVIALFSCVSVVPAQQPKVPAPHKAIPPQIDKPIKNLTPAMQRSMIGGLWMTDVSLKASIYLRNVVHTDSVAVTPILHLGNAVRYTLPDVTVKPASVSIISINDELQKKGISPWAGGWPTLFQFSKWRSPRLRLLILTFVARVGTTNLNSDLLSSDLFPPHATTASG